MTGLNDESANKVNQRKTKRKKDGIVTIGNTIVTM